MYNTARNAVLQYQDYGPQRGRSFGDFVQRTNEPDMNESSYYQNSHSKILFGKEYIPHEQHYGNPVPQGNPLNDRQSKPLHKSAQEPPAKGGITSFDEKNHHLNHHAFPPQLQQNYLSLEEAPKKSHAPKVKQEEESKISIASESNQPFNLIST